LLDFEDEVPGVDGVDLPAVHEDRVAFGDGELMHAGFERVVGKGFLKLVVGDTAPEADDQVGAGGGVGDVPVFGLWLAAEGGGHGHGRVDLEAEALAAVEPLDEDGEGSRGGPFRAHDSRGIFFQELAKRLSLETALRGDGLGFRAVDDLPAFADRTGRGKGAAQRGGQSLAAPDAFLIERCE